MEIGCCKVSQRQGMNLSIGKVVLGPLQLPLGLVVIADRGSNKFLGMELVKVIGSERSNLKPR